jgi:hypothetical protein
MTPERAALLLLRFHHQYPPGEGAAIFERATSGRSLSWKGFSLLVFRCAPGGELNVAAAEVHAGGDVGAAVVSLWDKVREKFPEQAAALEVA